MEIRRHLKLLNIFYTIINLSINYAYFLSNSIRLFNIICRFSFAWIIWRSLVSWFVKLTSRLFLGWRSSLLIFIVGDNYCWFGICVRLIVCWWILYRIILFICRYSWFWSLILFRNILVYFLFWFRFFLNWRRTFFIILSIWFIYHFCLLIFFFRLLWLVFWVQLFFNKCKILSIFIFIYWFFYIILYSKLSLFLNILFLFFDLTIRNFFFIWL